MSERKISEKQLKEIKMNSSRKGPEGHFGGVVEKPKNAKLVLKRLMSYISSKKFIIILLFFIVLIYTLCTLSSNVLLEKIISSFGEYDKIEGKWTINPNHKMFINSMALLIIAYLLHSIFNYLSTLISAYISVGTAKTMRKDLFAKIVYLPIKYIDRHPHGDIMSRMSNDITNISNAMSSSISSLIYGILTIIGCLAIMLFYSPLLTLVSLITLLLSAIVTTIMSKFMRPLFTKQQVILGQLNSQTEEMVSGCKTVIAYNHQKEAEKEFNDYSDRLTHTSLKAQIIGGSMGPIMNFIGNFGYFVVCFVGAIFVYNNIGNGIAGTPLTASVVVMFLTTTKQFTRPINEIAQLYSQLITALAGAERVFEVMDEECENFDKKVDFDVATMKGNIDFEHVNFSYVPEKQVLKDFSIDIYSGHKIALVGETGSGKTTIVNLLMRFYDVDSGTIKVDNIDINDISKKDLRSAVSIVLQDAVLFNDTILNNVKYGKENATDEEVKNALNMANCTSFVSKLKDKEQTILTEGATNISQGQRQLLTIARAVLANPKILILDEATSSVDTRTEKKIQDAMVKLMENRTSIIIAHRLSTIQDADLILVLNQGHIVELGTHQELIAKNGVYNKIYQTQFSGLNT